MDQVAPLEVGIPVIDLDAMCAFYCGVLSCEEVRRAEVEKALAALGPLPDEHRQIVEGLANAIVRKLLHKPVTRIRQESEGGRGRKILVWVKDLFDLDDGA